MKIVREYTDEMWTDVKAAVQHRSDTGSCLYIAMGVYEAAILSGGRFTVEDLIANWELDADDAERLLNVVREAWARGRWTDLRSGRGRRISDVEDRLRS